MHGIPEKHPYEAIASSSSSSSPSTTTTTTLAVLDPRVGCNIHQSSPVLSMLSLVVVMVVIVVVDDVDVDVFVLVAVVVVVVAAVAVVVVGFFLLLLSPSIHSPTLRRRKCRSTTTFIFTSGHSDTRDTGYVLPGVRLI